MNTLWRSILWLIVWFLFIVWSVIPTYAQSLPEWRQSATDQAYTIWLERESNDQERLERLIRRIDLSLPVYESRQRVQTLLLYIKTLAQNDLNRLSWSTTDTGQQEQPSPSNTDSYTNRSTQSSMIDVSWFESSIFVHVWSDSTMIVDEYTINARLEDFSLEELEVSCSNSDLIDEVHLISEAWVILDSTRLSGSAQATWTLRPMYTLERWFEEFYLAVTTENFWTTTQQLSYWDVTCSGELIEAQWALSRSRYWPIDLWEATFLIQPVIISWFDFVDEYEWYRVQNEGSVWSQTTLAIIELMTDETDATDTRSRDEEVRITTLTVTVSWVDQSDFAWPLLLQRLDRSTSTDIQWTRIDMTTVEFDLTSSSESVALIEPWINAWFRIEWTVTSNATVKFIATDLDTWVVQYRWNDRAVTYSGIATSTQYLESQSVRIR